MVSELTQAPIRPPAPGAIDPIYLKRVIKQLCTTGIRSPLTMEQIKRWLHQFVGDEEQLLALLILRHLLYRNDAQLTSSLTEAIQRAVTHHLPTDAVRGEVPWLDVVRKNYSGFSIVFSPAAHEDMQPGKSGDVMLRLIRRALRLDSSTLWHLRNITAIAPDERLIVVDDGTFTGEQLENVLVGNSPEILTSGRLAIAVGFAHEKALSYFAGRFPSVPVFYGEKLTTEDSLEQMAERWLSDGSWPHTNVSPCKVYADVYSRHQPFRKGEMPMGLASLGLMVAYEHGVPDDSLQLLWDSSQSWTPLFPR